MKQVLFLLFCGLSGVIWSQKNDTDQSLEQQMEAIKALNEKGLVIAFYDSDTLNRYYTYLLEQDSLLNREMRHFEKDVKQMQEKIQVMYMDLDKEQRAMILSGAEMQQKQSELEYRVKKLEEFQQTEGTRLQEKASEMQKLLESKVRDYSRLFCEKHALDMLLMRAEGGQFTYINPTLDVTNHFVEFVNREEAKNTK